jgi:capsular exopolysaccharide synthesis family protein
MYQKPSSEPHVPPQTQETELDVRHLLQASLRRWKVIAAVALLATAAATVTVFATKPVYQGRTLILIEKVGQNTLDREGVADAVQDDYYQTQYTILQSRSLAQRVLNDLKLARHPEFAGDDPVENLKRRIRIEPIRRTRLVNVIAESHDARLAAAVSVALARGYIEENRENTTYLSRALLKALDGKASRGARESLPAVVNNQLVQQLKGQLADLQGQWSELSKRYTPTHPRMIQLKAHIDETRTQIELEVGHIVESVRIQLSGEFKGNNVRIVDEAQVPAHPSKPRKLRTMMVALLAGLLAGFGLALLVDRWDLTVTGQEDVETLLRVPCLVTLQEYREFDRGSPDRFEAFWGDPKSPAAEAFRNLRTAVSFRLPAAKDCAVVLVTSSVQEEGKSFVAANLARALAQAGERVLLVDADLRRPSLHKAFGTSASASASPERGLSNFLADEREPEPLTLDPGVSHLKLLPCGPIPDNPAELLSERGLDRLLGWAAGEFRYVIVDSPPVFPFSDTLLLARRAHGALLVARAGRTRVAAAQRALHLIRDAFGSVLGAVVNMAPLPKLGYGYYYGGYSRSRYRREENSPVADAAAERRLAAADGPGKQIQE